MHEQAIDPSQTLTDEQARAELAWLAEQLAAGQYRLSPR